MASPAAQSSSEQQQNLSPGADGQQNQIPPPPPDAHPMAHYAYVPGLVPGYVPGLGQPALYQAHGNIPGRQARGLITDEIIGRQGKGKKATHTDAFHGPVDETQSGPQLAGEYLTRELENNTVMLARPSQEGVILDHHRHPRRIALIPLCVETLIPNSENFDTLLQNFVTFSSCNFKH